MRKSSHDRNRPIDRRRLAVTAGILTAIAVLITLGLPSYWIDLATLALAATTSPQTDHRTPTRSRRHNNRTGNQRLRQRRHNGRARRGTE